MEKQFTLFGLVVCAGLTLSSCKKDNDAPAPQVQQIQQTFDPNTLIPKQGKISGTVSGTRQNGTAFSYDFNYEGAAEGVYRVNEDGSVEFTIVRYLADYKNDLSNSVSLNFVLPKASDTTLTGFSNFYYFDASLTEPLDNNKLLLIRSQVPTGPTGNAKSNITLSNIKFDPNVGNFKADFTVTLDATENKSGHPAQINNGKIDVALYSVEYRKAAK